MKIFLRFLVSVLVLTAVTYFVQQWLVEQYDLSLFLGVKKISLFHLILSIGVLTIIYTTHYFLPKYTAFSFLATALVRMGAVIAFVFPLVKKTEQIPIVDTFFVVIPYFIFTLLEAIFTVKLIQQKR
ncbi:MAG: DUF6168 family protein [Capnocytophaga sp.]|nr:DUF6168 family protein [Capnocytophaga sp.]